MTKDKSAKLNVIKNVDIKGLASGMLDSQNYESPSNGDDAPSHFENPLYFLY